MYLVYSPKDYDEQCNSYGQKDVDDKPQRVVSDIRIAHSTQYGRKLVDWIPTSQ